jgi:hypothetical protein
MANLINATVYQIDGNPQKVATVVAFDTDKIRLQETTLSTISQVASFIEVQGEKLNAPVVKYFVSESVATLVAAANTGGVTLLQATIVAINDNPFKTSLQFAFPANKVTIWAFSNGTIQSFLQFSEDKFYATESKATLVAAANVSSGAAPYKVYSALIDQQDTNAPNATILNNTLGNTPTWSYVSVGIYRLTLNGAFPLGKVFTNPSFPVGYIDALGNKGYFAVFRQSDNAIQISVLDDLGTTPKQGQFYSASLLNLEIRVYN